MTTARLCALCIVACGLVACGEDKLGAPPPIGALRFVNAVADTSAMDFRVVDIIGNAPQFLENTFRAATPYQAVEAGNRHLKVFISPSRTDTLVGSPTVWDTTFTFVAGTNYTVVMTGFARTASAPALGMQIIQDDPSAPPAAQIRLRAINLGSGLGAIDAFWRRTAAPAPGTGFGTNLAFGGASAYAPLDTAALQVAATATGTTTPTLADVVGPPGVAGTPAANPIAGTRVAGSVLTAFLLPASVAGSAAPQGGAFAAPTILYVADRRPSMTVP
jgi:hypothetical protein